MPKKVSEIHIKEMVESFINGMTINQLSEKFDCSNITIKRHIKKNMDEKKFKSQIDKNKNKYKTKFLPEINNDFSSNALASKETSEDCSKDDTVISEESFFEIAPLNFEIDKQPQKDLSSVAISEINFPQVVYMIVDNKIELETKSLRSYSDWDFLSNTELNRTTIEIYFDIKIAKRCCNKEQKVIKVPNTNVFKIVAPILVSRGISRIVSPDKLIAL